MIPRNQSFYDAQFSITYSVDDESTEFDSEVTIKFGLEVWQLLLIAGSVGLVTIIITAAMTRCCFELGVPEY